MQRIRHVLYDKAPGEIKDSVVQQLQGCLREWEEDLLWAHFGVTSQDVSHLRLGLYSNSIFPLHPEWKRDVEPVLSLMEKIQPDVVSVVLDPEASGPDTHYKVLQVITQAVTAYVEKYPDRNLKIWAYRNVWFRFHPAKADIIIPVSLNSYATLKNVFHACFASQRQASFPSSSYDGPFCDITQQVAYEQYEEVKTLLGSDYLRFHKNPRIRAARGFILIREMTPEELLEETSLY